MDQRKLVKVSGDLQALPIPSGASDEERKTYESRESLNAAQLNLDGGMRTLSVYSSEKMSTLDYINRRDYDNSYGFYSCEDEWKQGRTPIWMRADIEAVKSMQYPVMNMDEAQDIADNFLKQVGIQDFVCERNEKVIGGSDQTWGDDSVRRGNLLKAYRLQYVRTVSGVPVTYTDTECAGGEEMHSFWYYERITFIIDDRGIAELQWYAPYRILGTVVDNASMLPFPQIGDVFENKIVAVHSWLDVAQLDINITEARLGLMRVTEQDNIDQGLLIPVWDFFGTFTQYTEQDGKRYTSFFKGTARSLLTVNAIDGAVIDRYTGY